MASERNRRRRKDQPGADRGRVSGNPSGEIEAFGGCPPAAAHSVRTEQRPGRPGNRIPSMGPAVRRQPRTQREAPCPRKGKRVSPQPQDFISADSPRRSLPAPGRTPAPLFRLAPPFAARLFCPAPKRSRRIFICVESLDILARRTQPR